LVNSGALDNTDETDKQSLTLIRMLPVAISLAGTVFRRDTIFLMGWLGPRDLASVVFTLIAFESFHEIARPHPSMFAIAGWAILLSVVLHGFSALPLARWYANRLEKAPQAMPEWMDVPDLESKVVLFPVIIHKMLILRFQETTYDK
jgi:sodium/hydrogen antiporter